MNEINPLPEETPSSTERQLPSSPTMAEISAELESKTEDFYEALNALYEHHFQLKDTVKGRAGMCGYAAAAMTEGLRTKYPTANVRMVYGHYETYDPDDFPPHLYEYHYWTEMDTAQGSIFLCPTYIANFGLEGETNSKKIVIDSVTSLQDKYSLTEFTDGAQAQFKGDEETIKALQINGGILPVRNHLEESSLNNFEEMINIISQ